MITRQSFSVGVELDRDFSKATSSTPETSLGQAIKSRLRTLVLNSKTSSNLLACHEEHFAIAFERLNQFSDH